MTIVRSQPGQWVMCDDENIEPIEESDLANYFGDNITGAGYVMFYQAVNLDLKSLGLKKEPTPRSLPPAPRVAAVVEDEIVGGTPAPTTPLDHHPTQPLFTATPASPTKSQSVPLPVQAHKDSSLDVPAQPRRGSSGVGRDPSPSNNRWSHHGGPISHSPGERGKWFGLKKKDGASGASTPADSRLMRQSTSTTVNTTSTESVDPLMTQSMPTMPDQRAMPDSRMSQSFHDSAPTNLSASIRSATSASSGGHPASMPNGGAHAPLNGHAYPTSAAHGDANGNGPASMPASLPASTAPSHHSVTPGNGNPNGAGDRMSRIGRSATASRADRASTSTQNGYSGGSGLGRKISATTGFSSLARRSSNAFKIGFGKKKQGDEQ